MNKSKILIYVFLFSIVGNTNIFAVKIRIINNMMDRDLTISSMSPVFAKTLNAKGGYESNNIKPDSQIQYIVTKAGSEQSSMSKVTYIPSSTLADAFKNPYPKIDSADSVSEIEISKGLISGVNFKTFFVDAKGLVRIQPKEVSDWYKVLGLGKNAKPEEILFKAGEIVGYNFEKKYKTLGSFVPTKSEELNTLYNFLKEKWSNLKSVLGIINKSYATLSATVK